MKHKTDLTKPSDQQLVDLINIDNNTTFAPTDLDIGIPKVNTDLEHSANNTVVRLANRNAAFGYVDVYYDRLSLSEFNKVGTPNLHMVDNFVGSFITAFNNFFNCNISINDVLLDAIPTPTLSGTLYTVYANPKSIVYIDSCVVNVIL